MTYTSDKRLYLDKDGKVVEDAPESGSLLVGEGGELSDEEAQKYGLSNKSAEQPDAKQVAEPPENKAQTMEKPKGK
jgi:hypothetical protein